MSKDITVIYLSTSTCAPCKTFFPLAEQKCSQVHGNIVKVVMDKIPLTEKQYYVEKYCVKSVPFSIVLQSGLLKRTVVGSKIEELEELLNR